VKAVWNLSKAHRETTPTRERICINGLWRWQPVSNAADKVPADGWGYFKVPACWPGITDYMQKDSQTVHAHPKWKDVNLRDVTAAWYQREITVPAEWGGRRITVSAEYLNSYAAVYVDDRMAGETRFPGGEVDLTSLCQPGGTYRLSLLVVAMPLKGVMLSYTDTASARQVKGSVARRGLCGDVYLVSTPPGPRITDLKVDTSVRNKQLTLDVALDGLVPNAQYVFRARIMKDGCSIKEFTSRAFRGSDLKEGRIASHSADNVSMQQAAPSHSGIKAVRRGHKLSLGKPAFYFRKHLLGHFYKAGAIFAVQPHSCSCSTAQALDTPYTLGRRHRSRHKPRRASPI
jgi:hypothetical protein